MMLDKMRVTAVILFVQALGAHAKKGKKDSQDEAIMTNATLSDLSALGLLQAMVSSTSIDAGVLRDPFDDHLYPIDDANPYTDLFSPESFILSDDGRLVTNRRSNETFANPIFRAHYDPIDPSLSGTLVQLCKDELGLVEYAEIRKQHLEENSLSSKDVFLVKGPAPNLELSTDGGEEGGTTMIGFTGEDIDEDSLREQFEYGDVDAPPVSDNQTSEEQTYKSGELRRDLLPEFVYRRGDGTSAECTYFKVVPIAIVYDAEFCRLAGGNPTRARNRILAIIASASIYYERDMCVKLQLTDIYSPDRACHGTSQTFGSFQRHKACGSNLPHALYEFSRWIASNRDRIGIRSKALVHYFTGFAASSTLGCAWQGTLCWDSWSYGIEYMEFSRNIATQAIVVAHEVGHNLNSPHLNGVNGDYIMLPKLSRGTDGFSAKTIDTVLSFLDSSRVQCDTVLVPTKRSSRPTLRPTGKPVARPTLRPSRRPTRPTLSPSRKPVSRPTPGPSLKPTSQPSKPSVTGTDCSGATQKSHLCVFANKSPKYECFSLQEVVEARFGPDCSSTVTGIKLTQCTALALEEDIPDSLAKNEKKDNKDKDKDKDKKKKKKNDFDADEDVNPSSIGKDQCGLPCITNGDRVCILAEEGGVQQVVFTVSIKSSSSVSDEVSNDVSNDSPYDAAVSRQFAVQIYVSDDKKSDCRKASIECDE